ncbi:MAG TPA: NAD(P)H-dependent glycerol-3-phosphate dehydrogenase [Candidatus Angelobacter sp.]|nr:NAD(P)H-dependent glycerol-3-phosphate dehydrogenase [Candidatus Angelobacter sp.]
MRIAVMGSGSWGTAFAMVLADADNDVVLWSRDPRLADDIGHRHENPDYHPGIPLPPSLTATADAHAALAEAEVVVLAVPAQSLRANLSAWAPSLPDGAILVSLMKGIEQGTSLRMSEVAAQVAGVPERRVAVVSGPNLAREIALRQPAATTVACPDEDVAERLSDACTTAYFRPYWTTDVVGTEIGGSVKNVIALANGMAVGMGYGENAQSALITRGLAEMTRLGTALGASPITFLGLAGIGDLIATCQSPLSRNRTFGEHLGQGLSMVEATAVTTQTCEGVKSCRSILDLAQRSGVDMPITEQVVQVVHHGLDPRHMLRTFMNRATKAESETG